MRLAGLHRLCGHPAAAAACNAALALEPSLADAQDLSG